MVHVLAEISYTLLAGFIYAVFACIPIYFVLPRFRVLPGEQFRLYCKLVFTFTVVASAFYLARPLARNTAYIWIVDFIGPIAVTYLVGRRFFLRKLPYNSLKR